MSSIMLSTSAILPRIDGDLVTPHHHVCLPGGIVHRPCARKLQLGSSSTRPLLPNSPHRSSTGATQATMLHGDPTGRERRCGC
eukprot:scaffold269_cov229-Pinguiococcus_pyrenoidosus.AAC.7